MKAQHSAKSVNNKKWIVANPISGISPAAVIPVLPLIGPLLPLGLGGLPFLGNEPIPPNLGLAGPLAAAVPESLGIPLPMGITGPLINHPELVKNL